MHTPESVQVGKNSSELLGLLKGWSKVEVNRIQCGAMHSWKYKLSTGCVHALTSGMGHSLWYII